MYWQRGQSLMMPPPNRDTIHDYIRHQNCACIGRPPWQETGALSAKYSGRSLSMRRGKDTKDMAFRVYDIANIMTFLGLVSRCCDRVAGDRAMMLQFVMSQEHLNLVKHTTKSIQIAAPHTQPYPPLPMLQSGGPGENNTKKRQNDYYLD